MSDTTDHMQLSITLLQSRNLGGDVIFEFPGNSKRFTYKRRNLFDTIDAKNWQSEVIQKDEYEYITITFMLSSILMLKFILRVTRLLMFRLTFY